jgi:hypothetical protein
MRVVGGSCRISANEFSCTLGAQINFGDLTLLYIEQGLESPSAEVIGLVSHATQDRLKTLVSKLSVIAEHRLDIIKTEGPYEVTDVSLFFRS